MADSMSLLEIAREIRPRLPNLLGEQAETVDQALAKLLERAEAGEDVDYEIRVLLGKHEATDDWKRDRLRENSLDDLESTCPRSGSSLAGDIANTPNVAKYACPIEGCSSLLWFPVDVSDPIPVCETHNVKFKRVAASS